MLASILDNSEVYCYKDIAYKRINRLWQNVAFLDRNNNKRDMNECFEKTFIEPLRKWHNDKQKGNIFCIECGERIKTDAMGISWLNDVGVDHKRKKNYFWNMQPNTLICPICALIYACSPLGFVFDLAGNAIFVNLNSGIDDLGEDKFWHFAL